MKLHISFFSYSRTLQRQISQHFDQDATIKVTGTKRVGDDGMRKFTVVFDFYERTQLSKFIEDYSNKYYILTGFQDILETDRILIDKETNSGVCGDYLISIEEDDLEHRAFHDLSKKELVESVRIWETWDDVLMRLSPDWQHDVFTNSVANLTYFDIEEVVVHKRKEFTELFPETGEFMKYMIDNKRVDYDNVINYMKARIDVGIYINRI